MKTVIVKLNSSAYPKVLKDGTLRIYSGDNIQFYTVPDGKRLIHELIHKNLTATNEWLLPVIDYYNDRVVQGITVKAPSIQKNTKGITLFYGTDNGKTSELLTRKVVGDNRENFGRTVDDVIMHIPAYDAEGTAVTLEVIAEHKQGTKSTANGKIQETSVGSSQTAPFIAITVVLPLTQKAHIFLFAQKFKWSLISTLLKVTRKGNERNKALVHRWIYTRAIKNPEITLAHLELDWQEKTLVLKEEEDLTVLRNAVYNKKELEAIISEEIEEEALSFIN